MTSVSSDTEGMVGRREEVQMEEEGRLSGQSGKYLLCDG